MSIRFFAVPWYGLAAVAGMAAAQPSTVTYDSAYAGYNVYREGPMVAWRALNDEAARIGGHVGIVRATADPRHEAKPGSAPADRPANREPRAGDAHSTRH